MATSHERWPQLNFRTTHELNARLRELAAERGMRVGQFLVQAGLSQAQKNAPAAHGSQPTAAGAPKVRNAG
jgi:uncharacterized protein (DUF1778 family)